MALVEQVKRKLNITWSDEDTDGRIADIIEAAIPSLKHKLGITAADYDFAEPGMENRLFLALCLYEWNHAGHEFDVNYANDIAQCRAMHEVAYYSALEGGSDG